MLLCFNDVWIQWVFFCTADMTSRVVTWGCIGMGRKSDPRNLEVYTHPGSQPVTGCHGRRIRTSAYTRLNMINPRILAKYIDTQANTPGDMRSIAAPQIVGVLLLHNRAQSAVGGSGALLAWRPL